MQFVLKIVTRMGRCHGNWLLIGKWNYSLISVEQTYLKLDIKLVILPQRK